MFVLGLQGSLPTWHFQAKVGTRHSSQRKQTASQYLLSLPTPQHVVGNGEKLPGCQTQGDSVTPLSLWSGKETEEAGTSVYRAGTTTSSGSVFPPLSASLRPSWTTVLAMQVRRAGQFFLLGGEHSHSALFLCSHCPVLTQTHLRNECLQ